MVRTPLLTLDLQRVEIIHLIMASQSESLESQTASQSTELQAVMEKLLHISCTNELTYEEVFKLRRLTQKKATHDISDRVKDGPIHDIEGRSFNLKFCRRKWNTYVTILYARLDNIILMLFCYV